jgi:hypothetical protein
VGRGEEQGAVEPIGDDVLGEQVLLLGPVVIRVQRHFLDPYRHRDRAQGQRAATARDDRGGQPGGP